MLKHTKNDGKMLSFFENFLTEDILQLEMELFPVEDLHIGEINPVIAQRIHNDKLEHLRLIRKSVNSNRPISVDATRRTAGRNPWSASRTAHRKCTGEGSYLNANG